MNKIFKQRGENIPNKYWVILFRRAMVCLACKLAEEKKASVLISGESVGQVASQTLSNIRAVDDAADFPILRPLSGMNKVDIINRATEIGTYEISVEPYEDCCSFFVPIHPETKADLGYVINIESAIDFGDLYNEAIEDATIFTLQCQDYVKKIKKRESCDIISKYRSNDFILFIPIS